MSDQVPEVTLETRRIGLDDEDVMFVLDGCEIPFIAGRMAKDESGQPIWSLTLDNRFGFQVEPERLIDTLWFLSNAMAVAGGYTCFGKGANLRVRFDRVPFDLPMVPSVP